MRAAETATKHIAGPPEREPDQSKAGWRWVQRCLRCDQHLPFSSRFFPAGAAVVETETESAGYPAFTGGSDEQLRIAATSIAPDCRP